jgi:hypothetical protein
MGVPLEASVGIEFNSFGEGQISIEELIGTGRVNRVIGLFCDRVQKPFDFLFVGWGFSRVIVSHSATNSFELVDVFRHVCAMYMPDGFY